MNIKCPLCEGKLVTEDMHLYTCISCDAIFTLEELEDITFSDHRTIDNSRSNGE